MVELLPSIALRSLSTLAVKNQNNNSWRLHLLGPHPPPPQWLTLPHFGRLALSLSSVPRFLRVTRMFIIFSISLHVWVSTRGVSRRVFSLLRTSPRTHDLLTKTISLSRPCPLSLPTRGCITPNCPIPVLPSSFPRRITFFPFCLGFIHRDLVCIRQFVAYID